MLVCGVATVLIVFAIANDGIHATSLFGLAAVVWAAFLLLGRRAGMGVALACVTIVSIFYAIALTGGGSLSAQIAPATSAVFLMQLGLLILMAAVMAYFPDFANPTAPHTEASDGRFRQAFKYLPESGYLHRDGKILCMNDAAARLYGLKDADEAIGRDLAMDIAAPIEREHVMQRLRLAASLAIGQSLPATEFPFLTPNNESRVIRTTTTCIGLADGPALLTMNVDVTERHRNEARAKHALDQAETAHRMKGLFIATLSHEIRTPLNGIIGLTEIVKQENLEPAVRARYLSLVLDSANTLLQLLSDILDFSKLEAGKLTLEESETDLHLLLERVADSYRMLARNKGIELSIHIAADVPRHAILDALRLRQVLSNLVANALKFTLEGRIAISAAYLDPGRLQFEVIDTGPGIPVEEQAHLFTPFFQIEAAGAARQLGAGLGLALCKHLAILMGGDIQVESRQDAGSAFTMVLPVVLPQSGASAAADTGIAAPPRALATEFRVNASTLVVEDNRANQFVIEAMLRRRGLKVTITDGGEAALAACRRVRFDLIFLDIDLPGMDGYEIARAIRKLAGFEFVPLVAYTASGLAADQPKRDEAGMNDLLVKPVTRDALDKVLARWLAAS